MHFLCTGKCKKVFELLYQKVFSGDDSFCFCDDGLCLIQAVLNADTDDAMIFMDYDLYKGFSGLFYDILKSRTLKIPLILVGDPVRNAVERMNYWVSINEFRYDVQNLHLMIPLFKKITATMDSPDLKSLVFAEAEKLPVLELAPFTKSCRQNVLEAFRKDNKLPSSIYNLLAFLFKHRSREVSVEEIVLYMNISGDSEKSKRNAVYAYISKLRRIIDCAPHCTIELLRTRRGYYKLFLR